MRRIQTDADPMFLLHPVDNIGEGEIEIEEKKFLKSLEELEFKKMLSEEEDQLNAMLEINPGAGGTESQDWAEILMRMYIMWGLRAGFQQTEKLIHITALKI
jgi:peptide chain release factor 2